MKQYVVKEAYTDNYHVLQYVDGVLEANDILSYYVLEGYIRAIENLGYTRAYFEPEYLKLMQQAKEEYDFAMEQYKTAQENSLVLSEKEVERYKLITHFEQ